jgi:hypothetical protein
MNPESYAKKLSGFILLYCNYLSGHTIMCT